MILCWKMPPHPTMQLHTRWALVFEIRQIREAGVLGHVVV